MSNRAIDRLAFLKEEYTDIEVLRVLDEGEYTEFVVDRNGDILTFRVYGYEKNSMFIVEK